MEQIFNEKRLWELYDLFIANSKPEVGKELSAMMALCLEPKQLKHPKMQPKILAWQAVRSCQQSDMGKNDRYYPIYEGEIVILDVEDREVFVSRIPRQSFLDSNFVLGLGPLGTKGLFIPIYDFIYIESHIGKIIEAGKNAALKFIQKQKTEVWFPD